MIFVDTGPFLARHIARDPDHEAALQGWERLRTGRQRCFTSNFVLDEAFTLLGRRVSHAFAAERARLTYASQTLAILRPTHEDEVRAVELFEKYADQQVSFTDCISFILMARNKIPQVFTFDRHFALAGFTPWPPGPT